LCDRPGLVRMPLAAQLFLALGDTGLKAGWDRNVQFSGNWGKGGQGKKKR